MKTEGGHPDLPPGKLLEMGSFSAMIAKEDPAAGSQAAFLSGQPHPQASRLRPQDWNYVTEPQKKKKKKSLLQGSDLFSQVSSKRWA